MAKLSVRRPKKRSAPRYTIKADQLADTIEEIVQVYSDNVIQATKQATDETAEEVTNLLKERSPKRTGEYAEGWKWSTVFDSPLERKDAVHNPTSYELIHLLEWGHVSRNQASGKPKYRRKNGQTNPDTYGFVQGKAHFMPTWEDGGTIFMKKLLEAIKNVK